MLDFTEEKEGSGIDENDVESCDDCQSRCRIKAERPVVLKKPPKPKEVVGTSQGNYALMYKRFTRPCIVCWGRIHMTLEISNINNKILKNP